MGIEAIVGKHICFLFCAAFCRSGHAMQVSVQCDSADLASAPYPIHLSVTGKTFAATSLVTPHAQYAYSVDEITSLAAKHMQPDAEEAVLPTIRKTPSQQEFNKCLQDEHSHQVDDEHSKQCIQEYLEDESEHNKKDGIGMKSATESGPGEERILTRLNANGERPTDVDGVGTDVDGAVAEVDGVLANDDGAEVYQKFYQHDPFVTLLSAGQHPTTLAVRGSNRCHLGITVRSDLLVVHAAIDNLGKGAAGQAVQCFNLIYGLEELSGLRSTGLYP